MNFDPVKCVKETISRVGYACEMNFDPLARHLILSGYSQITCSKWTLIHFQIVRKMNFDPFSVFDAIIGTKVEQSLFFEQIESGSKFILNIWSENIPKICDTSQVDQSSFRMHIIHVIWSPSWNWLGGKVYRSEKYKVLTENIRSWPGSIRSRRKIYLKTEINKSK